MTMLRFKGGSMDIRASDVNTRDDCWFWVRSHALNACAGFYLSVDDIDQTIAALLRVRNELDPPVPGMRSLGSAKVPFVGNDVPISKFKPLFYGKVWNGPKLVIALGPRDTYEDAEQEACSCINAFDRELHVTVEKRTVVA